MAYTVDKVICPFFYKKLEGFLPLLCEPHGMRSYVKTVEETHLMTNDDALYYNVHLLPVVVYGNALQNKKIKTLIH